MRKNQRHACRAKVQLGWTPEAGYPKQIQAECTNLSPGGMRVASIEAVEARSHVQYYLAGTPLRGSATVRSCRGNGERYILALEFTAPLTPKRFAELIGKLEALTARN